MAIRKPEGTERLFVVDVDMDNRSPEDIAKDAAMQSDKKTRYDIIPNMYGRSGV